MVVLAYIAVFLSVVAALGAGFVLCESDRAERISASLIGILSSVGNFALFLLMMPARFIFNIISVMSAYVER